jgi:hypothetical protein
MISSRVGRSSQNLVIPSSNACHVYVEKHHHFFPCGTLLRKPRYPELKRLPCTCAYVCVYYMRPEIPTMYMCACVCVYHIPHSLVLKCLLCIRAYVCVYHMYWTSCSSPYTCMCICIHIHLFSIANNIHMCLYVIYWYAHTYVRIHAQDTHTHIHTYVHTYSQRSEKSDGSERIY